MEISKKEARKRRKKQKNDALKSLLNNRSKKLMQSIAMRTNGIAKQPQLSSDTKQCNLPTFDLRENGEKASLAEDGTSRRPLLLTDIQHLIMYSILESNAPYNPARWCKLQTHDKLKITSVLIIDHLSIDHFHAYAEDFEFMKSSYDLGVEIISQKIDGDFIAELAVVPVTAVQMRKYSNVYGNMKKAAEKCDEIYDMVKSVFPNNAKNNMRTLRANGEDRFPRTDLLLSGWQMIEENIPLPIKGLWDVKYKGYVQSKSEYAPVTPQSPMFALDCEMCRTTKGELELTRVTITNEQYDIVYDELVKPDNGIIDYLTTYSGITARMMKKVTKQLADVQTELGDLLPADAIIVGQSINNDLHALKMMHPYIIDTSVIFNITGHKGRKTRLQTLSRTFLAERIQEGRGGHCSAEDSIASMKLAQLKLKKNITFGDASARNVVQFNNRPSELGDINYALSMFQQLAQNEKSVVVMCSRDLASKYSYFTFKDQDVRATTNISIIKCNSLNEIVEKASHTNECHLRIAHVRLNSTITPTVLQNVDNFIQTSHDNLPTGALSLVIFSGHNGSERGCCFIKIKK